MNHAFSVHVETLLCPLFLHKRGYVYCMQCPDSQAYITGSLATAWRTHGFEQIAEVTMYPWGHETVNKSADGQLTYECQHGPNECAGQRIQSCAAMVCAPSLERSVVCMSMVHALPDRKWQWLQLLQVTYPLELSVHVLL